MVRFWREHKTPDGSKYYYNIKTKQTTRERPVDFTDQEVEKKKTRLQENRQSVVFSLDVINGWKLILCQDGSRHYRHDRNEKLLDDVDDETCKELLAQLDQGKLNQLSEAAKSRYNNSGSRLYEEIVDAIAKIRNGPEEAAEGAAEEGTEESDFPSLESQSSAEEDNLIAGYGTSDDESDDRDDTDDDVNNNGNDQAGTDAISGSENFKKLFESYSLDPFSTWKLQSRKIQDDPNFYTVHKDSSREQIFEEWCADQCKGAENSVDAVGESSIESESELDSDTLEPTKYHYLSHIISKSAIGPTTLAKDIRGEQKGLFKQYKIKDTLNGKAQEAFISKLLFYYKKLDDSQRVDIFEKFLHIKTKIIKRGLRNCEKLREILSSSLPEEAFAIETQLLEMEDCIDIHGINRSLQEDVQYYVLGLKPKTTAMRAWFSKELDVSS
ncbi:Urn1p LALA0_S06e06612g [Lachancea lanzarotensis]|uniref:LALA0S06e06612g1_1 n=1 Tax=Lachancea lanzarotensis TaxID=1245769 RepID=A0A0C7NBH2_9SACH|nr:uncharacterized protein LALA0_S06e06612g [Lachancea lanzarotensis]CEP62908.1 LALA0S06e06612g1_1 [Lachancea lanzarotensis]